MGIPKKYMADPASEFMGLGEWFVRRYLPLTIEDEELFYEEKFLDAGAIIGKKYVKPKENDVDLSKSERPTTDSEEE